jgi:hypothetical protein
VHILSDLRVDSGSQVLPQVEADITVFAKAFWENDNLPRIVSRDGTSGELRRGALLPENRLAVNVCGYIG